jgi:hypothetical protein
MTYPLAPSHRALSLTPFCCFYVSLIHLFISLFCFTLDCRTLIASFLSKTTRAFEAQHN